MMRDSRGVDSLPVALAGSLILVCVIVSLAYFGLRNAMPVVSVSSIDRQLSLMADGCKMTLSGAPRDITDPGSPLGAIKTFTLSLPEDTEYVAFGADPEGKEKAEGVITYKAHGVKKIIVVDANVRFREGVKRMSRSVPSDGHLIIKGGGIYEITVEYAYDPGTGYKYLLT